MYSVSVFLFFSLYINGLCTKNADFCTGEHGNQLNEKCWSDKDCYFGLRCLDGLCKCAENEIETTSRIGGFFTVRESYCTKVPRYDQLCETVCQKPLKCVHHRCKCPKGLEYKDGICFKECGKDEFFAIKQGVCLKHCSENQIKINDTCFAFAAVGENCQSDSQCYVGFSWCQNGVCACKSGFKQKGDACQTESYTCPYGQPLTDDDGKVQKCEQTEGSGSETLDESANVGDSCPENYRCLHHPGTHGSRGHCCPKLNHGCIIGEPLAKVTCDYRKKEEGVTFCPYNSYACHFNYDGENICCPRACGSYDDVFRDGKCYPSVKLGERCFWDEQCQSSSAVCIEGTCQCGENAKVTGGYGGHRYCAIVCKLTEFRNGSNCYPKNKIGEHCDKDITCPYGSKCNSGKCECRCKHTQYGNYFCVEDGSLKCPSYRDPNNDTLSEPQEAKPIFCTMKHSSVQSTDFKEALLEVVDQCPNDKFCHSDGYIPGRLGLCCPKPALECPHGDEVIHTNCNPRVRESCQGGYCHRMFYPADYDSNEGYVCCRHRHTRHRRILGMKKN